MVNLDNISFIEDSHGKKAVILSMETYENMVGQLEELEDIEAYIKVKNAAGETFPLAVVEKLILGNESKVKVFREYRGKNLTQLSKMLGISEAYLSQIENQKRKGSIDLYKKLARILEIDIEAIL